MPPTPEAAPAGPALLDAWLGLGSNLGYRAANLRAGLKALDNFAAVQAVSSVYETAPVGYLEQPAFLNMAVHIQTSLTPDALMDRLLEVERDAGRDRATAPPQGPRTLDLDILLLSRQGQPLVLVTPRVTVPHPRLHERRFVLTPLAEIAPDHVHPLLQRTMTELLSELPRPSSEGHPNASDRVTRWTSEAVWP